MLRVCMLAIIACLLGCVGPGRLVEADPHAPAALDQVLAANDAQRATDPDAAAAELDALIASQPQALRPRLLRCRRRLDDGHYRAAIADADAMIGTYGSLPTALVLRGRARAALGLRAAAQADLSAALDADPLAVDALVALGQLHAEAGRGGTALRYLDRAHQLAGERDDIQAARRVVVALNTQDEETLTGVEDLVHAGSIAVAAGDHQRGTGLLLRALAIDPDHVEALRGAARGFAARGRDREAVQLLRRAARLKPDEALLQAELGAAWLRWSIDDTARALHAARAFDRAAELARDAASYRHAAARAYVRCGRLTPALDHYRALLDAGGGDDLALQLDFGLLLQRMGDHAGAISALERAHAIDPEDERAAASLMSACYRAGDAAGAAELRAQLAARDHLRADTRALLARYSGEAP